jgi:hypothetical protein
MMRGDLLVILYVCLTSKLTETSWNIIVSKEDVEETIDHELAGDFR